MKRFWITGAAVAVLLLAAVVPSCRDADALSRQTVVTAIGVHRDGDRVTLSAQTVEGLKASASLSEQDKTATTVQTASGRSVTEALTVLGEQAGRTAYTLHNRLLLISEETCRSVPLSDWITADAFALSVPIAVCYGDPQTVLEAENGNDAIPSAHIVNLLREGERCGTSVLRTVLDVRRALSGMYDAVLPIVTVRDDRVITDGVALFRDGWMVGRLSSAQTAGLLLLGDELREWITVMDGVTYRVEQLRTHIRAEKTVQVILHGHLRAVEQQTDARPQKETVERLLRDTLQNTLHTLDELDCDPLGLSRRSVQVMPSLTWKTARSTLSERDKAVSVSLDFDRLVQGKGIQ